MSREDGSNLTEKMEKEVLYVEADDFYYGIELCDIIELIDDAIISPVPRLPDFYEGVCSFKGTILPVISFRRLAGLSSECGESRFSVTAAVKGKELECGFFIKQRPELFHLKPDEILSGELPDSPGERLKIKEMYSVNGKVLFLLDIEETLKGLAQA